MEKNSLQGNNLTKYLFYYYFTFIFQQSIEEGARTIIYATISPELEDKGGVYLTNCLIKAPVNKIAHDDMECEKLFNYTCDMLKIKNYGKEEIQ